MKHYVIVIGKKFLTTFGVVRSLARVGHKINVVYVTANHEQVKILSISKYIKLVVINEEMKSRFSIRGCMILI